MIWNDAGEDKDGVMNVKLTYNNLPVDNPTAMAKSSSTKDQDLLKKRKRIIDDDEEG